MISLKEVMLAINRKINESLQMNVDSKKRNSKGLRSELQ